ncbi:MAG: right-handed parallel beta-helix repeat-containing protein, partial [Bacteroidia bacterium]
MRFLKKHFTIVLTSLAFGVCSASAATCTKTISSGQSIQSIINGAVAGDVICVHAGTYHEKITMSKSGTASSPITLIAYTGESPVIDGQNTLPSGGMYDQLVNLSGNYIIMDGFEVRNSAGRGVILTGTYNTVRNCNIHNSYDAGLYSQGDNNTLEYNQVWQNVQENLNGRCSPTGNPCYWATGISAARDTVNGITDNTIIRGNISHDNWGEGIDSYEAAGTLIENNISYNNFSADLYVSDSRNVIARNNLVYATRGESGITIADENSSVPRSSNNQITNNIIYGANLCEVCWTSVTGLSNISVTLNTIVNGPLSVGASNGTGIVQSANCVISASQVPGLGTI